MIIIFVMCIVGELFVFTLNIYVKIYTQYSFHEITKTTKEYILFTFLLLWESTVLNHINKKTNYAFFLIKYINVNKHAFKNTHFFKKGYNLVAKQQ